MDLPVSESLVNFHFPVNTALVDAVQCRGECGQVRGTMNP